MKKTSARKRPPGARQSQSKARSPTPAPAAAPAPLSVVVLAAGQGKRMKSALPKVLQPLAGRALLAHVLDARACWTRRGCTSCSVTAAKWCGPRSRTSR